MRVRLIRHGTTAGNAARRYVGRTDDPLCPEGREAAERHEKDPAQKSVFVSPLKRARETAAILFPNAEQIVVDGLMEMDFGDFEGRTADEMANDPVYRAWVDDLCRGACPNGESQAAFHARVGAAFTETLRTVREDATFVVHGGVIMSVLWQFAEPKKDFYDWYAPNLGGYEADCGTENGAVVLRNVRPIV
ncbi:MAG: histidine phosphatase family protein [Clostridia bacterium]|nr:histidine phosphatase family protein [Clostridia bacterium]